MSGADARAAGAGQRELRGALAAGTRLQKYELVSVLGQGGFGITYHARDTQLDRDVAIKEYLPTSLALREQGTLVVPRSTDVADDFIWGRERFLDEARTLAKLGRAPAIVRVFDFLEANGTAYMVMALAEGETLEHRLRRDGVMPSPVVEQLLRPLLDGLEQVHAIGFLHRDIKPANIILDDNNAPTLIDFGASRAAMVGRSTAMTAIFTPGYAAAEQFTSAQQGPWTDIYGLSATLYQTITGKVPPSAFDRILQDTYEPLGQLRPVGFAPGLLSGIDAGLAVRSMNRPQTIAQWRPVLAGSMDFATTQVLLPSREKVAGVPKAGAKAPLSRSTRTALGAVVATALFVVAGGAYYMISSEQRGFFTKPVQSLTAEELEQVLAERRKADVAAAEKKRLEDEAQRQVDIDAKAKAAADAELAKAQEQRRKAEEELATLRAKMESRRLEAIAQREQAAAAAQRAIDEAAKRDKAEADIAALRRADEEARTKALAEADAKRVADEEAQRKAEADAAALRQAEQAAQKKAAAEAEAKRLADEALARAQTERQRADEEASRQKAEYEAKRKAEAEAKARAEADAKEKALAKTKAEAAEKKMAEATENGLGLAAAQRQRLQVALTSLGFDTKGTDGTFGPRSREMIAGWQKAHNLSATGFLDAAQQQALLKEAAAAVGKYDDEQKKAEEESKRKADDEAKKKLEEEAKAKAAAIAPQSAPVTGPAAPPAAPASPVNPFDGDYSGIVSTNSGIQGVSVKVVNGSGSGQFRSSRCGLAPFELKISADKYALLWIKCGSSQTRSFSTRMENNEAKFSIPDLEAGTQFVFTRRGR